jgi:hypothetical protein
LVYGKAPVKSERLSPWKFVDSWQRILHVTLQSDEFLTTCNIISVYFYAAKILVKLQNIFILR